jgi:Apea-like HEPN
VATANLQPGEIIGLPGGRWKSTGPGQFQREEADRPSWVIALHKRADQLHALPEYQEIVSIIEANANWRAQFGTLVGTRQGRTRLDIERFVDHSLGTALSAGVDGGDRVAAVVEQVASMERFLERHDLTIEIFGPLSGFNAPEVGRIQLAPNLSIDPIDEGEVERLFSIGLLTPIMPQFPFVNAPSHLARATYQTPKVVGDVDPPHDPASYTNESKPAEEAIEDLLVCLRMLKPGQVALGGKATVLTSHLGGASWRTSPGRTALSPHFHSSYSLHPDEVDALRDLWRQFHSPGTLKAKQLTLAARRFSYKGDRSRIDDQLVDLMVAAEALFLGDNDEEYRGELRFRLASRAASYVADAHRDGRSIFRLFMTAYRMRSRLVHGGEAKPLKLDGDEVSPERMVEVVEDVLRAALKQAFTEASGKPTRWTVDWVGLLFPSRDKTGALDT